MSQVSFDMPASDLDEPEQGKKLKKIILLFYKTMNSPLIKDQEFKMKKKKKKKIILDYFLQGSPGNFVINILFDFQRNGT